MAEQQPIQRFRLAGLLGFVVAMPILALPAVNERLDSWLFAAPAPPSRGVKGAGPAGDLGVAGVPNNAPPPSTATDRSPAVAGSHGRGATVGEATVGEADGAPGNVERLPPADLVVDLRQFAACQTRLQELGAAYFRLEDTGEAGARYRFRCEVPLPGNASYLRPFEQEHDDPLEAMRQTVAEVEQWCAAHRMRKAVLTLPPNK